MMDTTGIEPDFALVKFKKLAGGGYFKIVNQSVPKALKQLGYKDHEIKAIKNYVIGFGSLKSSPNINVETLMTKGFLDNRNAWKHFNIDIFDAAGNLKPLWEERVHTINPHRSLPSQQDWQVLWLGLVAQVWWFQIKQA